ncbi:hypothetical protein D3C75_1000550 [compost metagenome]
MNTEYKRGKGYRSKERSFRIQFHFLARVCCRKKLERHEEGKHADRHIDNEDPMPVDVFNQGAG